MAEDEGTQTEETEEEHEEEGKPDQLGEAGKRAIAEERAARKAAEKSAKAAKAELDKLRTEGQSEQEKAIAKAKADGSAEALQKANARVLRAEVKAAAAGKLADPNDAPRFLDLSDFEVGDDGDVDSKAIAKAIDQLVKEKPYLAGSGKGGTNGKGSADGGARGGASAKPDMNAWLRGEASL